MKLTYLVTFEVGAEIEEANREHLLSTVGLYVRKAIKNYCEDKNEKHWLDGLGNLRAAVTPLPIGHKDKTDRLRELVEYYSKLDQILDQHGEKIGDKL